MGISITATIAYGCWYDPDDDLDWLEDLLDEDDDFDFDGIIARHAGIEPLDFTNYPDRGTFPYSKEFEEEHDKAYKRWREEVGADEYYDRKAAAIKAAPLDLDYAGHGERPTYVIHLRGHRWETYWSPEAIPDTWVVNDADIAKAKAFAAELGIPWDNPDWLLYPFYSH